MVMTTIAERSVASLATKAAVGQNGPCPDDVTKLVNAAANEFQGLLPATTWADAYTDKSKGGVLIQSLPIEGTKSRRYRSSFTLSGTAAPIVFEALLRYENRSTWDSAVGEHLPPAPLHSQSLSRVSGPFIGHSARLRGRQGVARR